MICQSCRGIGCSACQRTYTMGRITFQPPVCFAPEPHMCPLCMRGLPCADLHRVHVTDREWKASQPSLSGAIGAVIERTLSEPDRRSRECQ